MLGLLTCGGCTPVGALAYIVTGPPSVPAQYVPAREPTLLLVESSRHPSAVDVEADQLARFLQQELKTRAIVPLIDQADLYRLRDGGQFQQMTIPEIGRAVGAKQVLYVDLIQADIGGVPASGMLRGTLNARVQMIDANSGLTLWPDAAEGFPIGYETPIIRQTQTTAPANLRRQLHRGGADRIAKLFYRWKADGQELAAGY